MRKKLNILKVVLLNNLQCIEYKERLNTFYSKKINGTWIRSKCDWYENLNT